MDVLERNYLMLPAEWDALQQFIFHLYIQSGGLYIYILAYEIAQSTSPSPE